jgi:hypothetical protein
VQELTREQVLESLTRAYEAAVVAEAMRRGGKPRHFGDAAAMLPPEVFERMRTAFRKQTDELK